MWGGPAGGPLLCIILLVSLAASAFFWLDLPGWTSPKQFMITGQVRGGSIKQVFPKPQALAQVAHNKMRKGKKTGNPAHYMHLIV